MNGGNAGLVAYLLGLTTTLLAFLTYGLMSGYGLLVCGSVQEQSGVNTHYNLVKGCRVVEGGQDTPLSKWLSEN